MICVKYQKEKYRVSKNKEEKTEENEDILLVEGKKMIICQLIKKEKKTLMKNINNKDNR